ncbi:tRNA glutamyl-Q(34) synthetase GluQRS [Haliea sp. E17]|uniref:tRNA glutamyl-Q(34) synthetase GluQRS n=1 Tax=Haliea sp. E17 TaxID=3401576 RepID=UPI003AAFA768
MPDSQPGYRGRFAPSPTGPLHLGSLIAALASYLEARRHGGAWLVRMEDLDPPREEPGAAASILDALAAHGLHPDEDILWQSARHAAYDAALQTLGSRGLLFRCDCTRAMLGPGGACGGRCAPRQSAIGEHHALRIRVPDNTVIHFRDGLQGEFSERLDAALPDFVLRRKDGLYAYQLAVVVDDGFQDITHIVRGSDLLDSTARQLYLQACLGLPHPHYLHLPVITHADGQKLSKQNHAPPLVAAQAGNNLRQALDFLNQPQPPAALRDCDGILASACANWNPAALPPVLGMPGPRDAR